jgi:hypothetical protein
LAEGLSKKDVLRCLKRFIAREVFYDLKHDLLTTKDDLRLDGRREEEVLVPLMETDPCAAEVFSLTQQGMRVESDGDFLAAMALYERAASIAEGPHAECIAEHFMARHRSPSEELEHNLQALALARKVGDDRVADYFASFLGCVGLSYERAGRPDLARSPLEEALEHLGAVPPGDYKDSVELDIRNALSRVAPEQPLAT